jgi:ankyrin repeat protein
VVYIHDGDGVVRTGIYFVRECRCLCSAGAPGCAPRHRSVPKKKKGCFNTVDVAAARESTECMQVLLDFKADVTRQDRGRGLTPLHAAAMYGRAECVRLLLEKNADVAIADRHGQTVLMLAACKGRLECLKVLIDAKGNVNQQSNNGFTGLHLACQEGHVLSVCACSLTAKQI